MRKTRDLAVRVDRLLRDVVIPGHGGLQLVFQAALHAPHGARLAGVGLLVVALGQIPWQVRHGERHELIEVERLDRVHVRIGHLRRAVGGNALEVERSLAVRLVDVGLGDFLVARGVDADVLAFVGCASLGVPVVKPKRHVDALHVRDAVALHEFFGKELLSLVVRGECGSRLFFAHLEGNDEIGLCLV